MCMYFDEAGQHRTDEGSCITWMSECLTQADYYVFGMEFLEPRSKGKFPRNADTEILGFRDEAGGNWTDEGCEVLLVEETRIQCGRSGGGATAVRPRARPGPIRIMRFRSCGGPAPAKSETLAREGAKKGLGRHFK